MERKAYKHSEYFLAKQAEKARLKKVERDAAKFGMAELEYAGEYMEYAARANAAIDYCNANRLGDDGDLVGLGKMGRCDPFSRLATNALLLSAAIAIDIGRSIVRDIKTIADPYGRKLLKREMMRTLRQARRPFYYARETERRHKLAFERRKIRPRTTTAPMPSPEDIRKAWNERKNSPEAAIRLGGMLQDLECYVDNRLKFDEYGNIIGRNHGIRGWINFCVPELAPKYKTLMRYKAMAIKLRQATKITDPIPTERLLTDKSDALVAEIISIPNFPFAAIERKINFAISPLTVADDPSS